MSTLQWQESQIKSFTRWINGYISKRGLKVEDLQKDLIDGVILINLLEILTGKTMEKYYKAPKSKTYMIANNSIALAFMGQQKLGFNCSAQDLADGRITMQLGLIWSLIRHFSFKAVGKHLLSKTQLLAWCKSMVEGYCNIRFDGSLQSFQDGLILCALIHKYDATLLDYDLLDPKDGAGNLRKALAISEIVLGIPKLLDFDNDSKCSIDERSLSTYLAEIYNMFQRKAEFINPSETPRLEPNGAELLLIDNEDIIQVAEKYASIKPDPPPPVVQIDIMKAEIEQLHIQIMHLTEEYETRLQDEREEAEREIQIREEKIESLERKIEEYARHQGGLQFIDFDQHAQWNFINEQRKTIIWERKKLEKEKQKLAEDQDLLQKAQIAIQKQKDEITEEKEKFGKDKRALLKGDLKMIDLQGREVASQIEAMRDELRIAKIAIERLKDGEFYAEYLEGVVVDEYEAMQYYNDAWWDSQRQLMVEQDSMRTNSIIFLQTQVRMLLAQLEKNKLARFANATVVKRCLRKWRAKRIQTILKRYEPHIAKVILVQSIARRWSVRRTCKTFARRTKIAHEILESEKTYVARLEVVVKVFIDPLRILEVLTKEQTRAIFSEIEVILGYNKMLLKNLEVRMNTWNYYTNLGDIFNKMTYFLKAYTQYVNNYNTAITTISAVKQQNEKVAAFLMKCNKDSRCLGQDIGAFLILPVQRIPRYVMLLTEILNNTKPKHTDYEDLRISLWKMKHVADYLNDRKSDAENIHEVLTVQDKLTGRFDHDLVLALPHRRYLREGFLLDIKEKKKVYYFLFNDLMIGTKKKNPKKPFTVSYTYKYLHRINLRVNTSVIHNPNAKTPNFVISTTEMCHTFAGSTPEETKSWFISIHDAVAKLSALLAARNTPPASNRHSIQLFPQ